MFPAEKKNTRLDGIEAARAIAVLMVLGLHFTMVLTPLVSMPLIGAAGVDIFFVVSGFVISMSADRLRDLPASRGALRFFLLRIGRVWPLWAVALILYALAVGQPVTVADLLLIPRMENGFVVDPLLLVGWTLRFELFFYGLTALALLTRQPFWILGAVLPALCLLGLFVDRSANGWIALVTSPFLIEFWFGVLGYLAWKRGWLGQGSATSLIAACAMCLGTMLFRDFGYNPSGIPRELLTFSGQVLPRWVVWGVPSAAVVLLLVRSSNTFARPQARMLLWVGSASYMLYLGHPFAMRLVDSLAPNDVAYPVAALIMVGIVAAVLLPGMALDKWLEKPLLAMLRTAVSKL